MPQPRNKLGQFTKNEGENYITLPAFTTMFKWALIFVILYPWYDIISGIKLKIFNLFKFLLGLIPDNLELSGSLSGSTKKPL